MLERLDLTEVADRRAETYSGGLRRRLDVGAGVVGRPRLPLLDEPTTGLDPRSRRTLWELITELVADGTDVLLTTQYLEEADRLADRIVILDRGRIAADGTAHALKESIGAHVVTVSVRHARDLPALDDAVRRLGHEDRAVDTELLTISWSASTGGDDAAPALRELAAAELPISELTVRRPSLDEVFLHVTGAEAARRAIRPACSPSPGDPP